MFIVWGADGGKNGETSEELDGRPRSMAVSNEFLAQLQNATHHTELFQHIGNVVPTDIAVTVPI
jgi:hypothetical protein